MQGISSWQLDNPTRGLRSIQLDIQSLKRRNSASRSIRPCLTKLFGASKLMKEVPSSLEMNEPSFWVLSRLPEKVFNP